MKRSKTDPGGTLRFIRKGNKPVIGSYKVRFVFPLPFTLSIYDHYINYVTIFFLKKIIHESNLSSCLLKLKIR